MTAAAEIEIVVAMDAERGIGKDGGLPWRLPGDMAHFVEVTRQTDDPGKRNAVIMGRKTWESIPERFQPLADRLNVVVTRNRGLSLPPGVERAHSLAEAVERAAASVERVFVIGGASLYAEALASPACRCVHLTRIEATFDCDTFFPVLAARFEPVWRSEPQRDGAVAYRFERWTGARNAT